MTNARRRQTVLLAVLAGAASALAACVPAAGPQQGAAANPAAISGPGFGVGQSNGVWSLPAFSNRGALWSSTEGSLRLRAVEQSRTATTVFTHGVYEDGTRLVWGNVDVQTGRWQGNWVRVSGPVACLVPLTPPPTMINEGVRFMQPLSVWGTFDVILNEQTGTFNGTWGGCGIPVGGIWNGTYAGQ